MSSASCCWGEGTKPTGTGFGMAGRAEAMWARMCASSLGRMAEASWKRLNSLSSSGILAANHCATRLPENQESDNRQ